VNYLVTVLFIFTYIATFSQPNAKTYIEDEADIALQKMSLRYESYKSIKADFKLLVVQPKTKPTDDESKLTDTILGTIFLKSEKFKVQFPGQEIYCDGKNIWAFDMRTKEVQLDLFEENDDVFSPAKLFNFYKTGFSYQVKEKKTINGKKVIVVEMSPVNKKTSYFKIDATIDEANSQLLQTKLYSKNGVRYIYTILAEKANIDWSEDFFVFDAAKHPGTKLVDLR
jgi:outer membrane lipoprotein-sorting protein